MDYVRYDNLMERKRKLRVSNIDLSKIINCSPSTVAQKLNGYTIMRLEEKRKITEYLDQVERKQLTEAT